MRIRITGVPVELDHAVQCVASVLPVVKVSRIYPSRSALVGWVELEIGPVVTSELGKENPS